jgi:murein DD-endopeptidase MepM/ murein hydrolase activator NlpD
MLDVHGLLEAEALHERYKYDPIREDAGEIVVRIGATTALVGASWLLMGGEAKSFDWFQRDSQPPVIRVEPPAGESSPKQSVEPTLEQLKADITLAKVRHLSDSNWVLLTQKKLAWLGYDVGEIDGVWGAGTATAVMKFQYEIGLPATGEMDDATKQALFDGVYPTDPVQQAKPLALWSPAELLSGSVPHNGRGRSTSSYINGWPVISHQYMRTLPGQAPRPHRGVDLPFHVGHEIYALGTEIKVWYDAAGGGLVIEMFHPATPGLSIRNLHSDSAFGKNWQYYRANGPQYFTVAPHELGRKVIGRTGDTGSGAQHAHLEIKVVGGNVYEGDRDPNDSSRLLTKTTLISLAFWGVDHPLHVTEGPVAYGNHSSRVDVDRYPNLAANHANVPLSLVGGDSAIAEAPAAEAVSEAEVESEVESIEVSDNEVIEFETVSEIETVERPEPEPLKPAIADAAPMGKVALPVNAAANAIARLNPQTQGNELLSEIFKGGENSMVTIAVGSAEGTRTPDGGKTRYWKSHTDPGNQAHNIGSFSFQHHDGTMSPSEADQRQLDRLMAQLQPVLAEAEELGLQLTLREALNLIDLLNQSPWAGGAIAPSGQWVSRSTQGGEGYVPRLLEARQMGKTGTAAITHARIESYKRTTTGTFWADGLCYGGKCNTWEAVYRDQTRRMNEIDKALKASKYSGREVLLAGSEVAVTTEVPVGAFPESVVFEPAPVAVPEPEPVDDAEPEGVEEVATEPEKEVKPTAEERENLIQQLLMVPSGRPGEQMFTPKQSVDPLSVPRG